jgi:hypothetical protein
MKNRTTLTWILVSSLFAGTALADDYAAQADRALAQTKPSLGDSAADASVKCQRLSDEARARGARTLLVAFEGLASFSAASTTQAYRYLWELNHHLPATPPAGALTGFVVNGTLVPLIRRYPGAIEVLAFPYGSQSDAAGSVPERCALEWMKVPGRHLVVIGHSFGGDAAVQLMGQLEARQLPVDLAVTLDPVPKTPRPYSVIHTTRNARRWENYYQRGLPPRGASLPSARVNVQLHVAHTAVPFQPEVASSLAARVGELTR